VLQRAAPEGMVVERFRDDLPALLRRCRVSVSQAGYNTVLEIIAARARAVLVPFTAERETEQLLRAERLAAFGAVELVREPELSPKRLALAIERAASRPPPELSVDMTGAVRSARIIAAMLNQAGGSPPESARLS
jgi:predicted glycosyltransferase